MAVIHISEQDAVSDPSALFAKVRAGAEVRISGTSVTIAVAQEPPRKTLSEAIRLAEERNDDVTLDGQFERDLDAVIMNHEHEAGMRNPWED